MRRKEGFTLIELLVVIAITALLAAILFPVFGKAREKARQVNCISNLKQMGTAWLMYAQDWDDYAVMSGGPVASDAQWALDLGPYIKSIPECPSNDYKSSWSMNTYLGANNPLSNNYAYNAKLGYINTGYNINGRYTLEDINKGRLRQSNTAVFCDAAKVSNLNNTYSTIEWSTEETRIGNFHSGGTNIVFADAHAAWKRWDTNLYQDYFLWLSLDKTKWTF